MRSLGAALAVAVVLSACSGGGDSVVGGDSGPLDTGSDLGVDAGSDLGVDTGADLGVDAPAPMDAVDAGPSRCTSAADCAANAEGNACDTATGRCVPCTPADDRCPVGQYCTPLNACAQGCAGDDDCAGATADGGVADGGAATSRCDVSTRLCVSCLTNDHCPLGNLCVGGACVVGCAADRGCPSGQSCCDGACLDLQSNPSACGACGARCAVANGVPACVNAVCGVGACTAPYADCDGSATNGCETDTRVSVEHCGACGAACAARPHATTSCASGGCAWACEAGFADCDGEPSNGCEVDTRGDVANCGACGTSCALPNATSTCASGRCAVASCGAGFADCDGASANGCEVDTATNVTHCGGCGMACAARPNAIAACAASACVYACVVGFQDCDGDASNGCEVDARTSVDHCGACGRSCRPSGGSAVCAGGTCTLTTCEAGRADCNGRVDDGCEVNTQGDVSNCGVCGNACPARAGATATCAAGSCGFTCAAGQADCDGDPSNGCEVDTRSSDAHCGACGNACAVANGAGACVGSACRVTSCREGYADCDGSAANGCETSTETSGSHCGRCGNACASGQACYAGACSVRCSNEAVIPGPAAGCVNVAPRGTATASSSYTAGSTPPYANDGNRCTGWNAGGYAVRYWQVDLRSAVPIRGVTLVPDMAPSPAAVTHVVEVSNDGAAFSPVRTISQTMANGGTYVFDLGSPVTARYVRVRTTSSPSWVAWGEVAVFRCD